MPVAIQKMLALTPHGEVEDLWLDLLAGRAALSRERIPRPNWGCQYSGAKATAQWARLATVALSTEEGFQARRPRVYCATTKALADNETPVRPIWNPYLGEYTTVISNACVSGSQAVIEAVDALEDGDRESAIVVGLDLITDFVAAGFDALQARSSNPARPFDTHRDGLSLGETGCCILLQRVDQDSGLGPRIVSYGCSNDANHISGPSRDGGGLALAIERALVGVDRRKIIAICAHGTATQYNDAMEARAFHTVFGPNPPPVFGIKGAIGHTLGAAGLIEVIVSAMVATEGVIPPTVGYEQGEDDFPLDVVHGKPRKVAPGLVLTTNSGFGGMNTAIVIGPGA